VQERGLINLVSFTGEKEKKRKEKEIRQKFEMSSILD
jgi:hypothetical protein